MTTIYDYADVLRALADKEALQHLLDGSWQDISAQNCLSCITARQGEPSDFRVKPKAITINGVACEPPNGVTSRTAYHVAIALTGSDGTKGDAACLLGFDSYVEALAAYKALLLPFKVKS